MNRSAMAIAETALDDLWEAHLAFDEVRSVFVFLLERSPEGDLANALAELGLSVVDAWSLKLREYCVCMDDELDDLREPSVETPIAEMPDGVVAGERGHE